MINNKIYKPLEEATEDELIAIYNNNHLLQQEVEERYVEDEKDFIDDIMDVFRSGNGLKEWSVDFYNNNYIVINNEKDFIKDLKKLSERHGVLEERYDELIDNYFELEYELNLMSHNNKQYGSLSSRISNIYSELREALKDILCHITTIEDEYLLCYYTGGYARELIAKGNFYYDKDYNLVEEVHHIIKYN